MPWESDAAMIRLRRSATLLILGLVPVAGCSFPSSTERSLRALPAPLLPGVENLDVVCTDPVKYTQVIRFSDYLMKQGVPAGDILTALSCIARAPGLKPTTAGPAVWVAFQVAPDDAARRTWLRQVIEADGTTEAATSTACELLVYVADGDSRSALLNIVQEKWPDVRAKYALEALVELGEERLVTWLDERSAELGVVTWLDERSAELGEQDPIRRYFGIKKKKIMIQKNVPEMLRMIEARDSKTDRNLHGRHGMLDRDWLVRHAIRNGALPGEVRQRVITHARSLRAEFPRKRLFPGMQAAHECRLFTQQDTAEFEGIRQMQERQHISEWDDSWVTLPNIKRAEFYCQPRQ